jgi:hypothetical protein
METDSQKASIAGKQSQVRHMSGLLGYNKKSKSRYHYGSNRELIYDHWYNMLRVLGRVRVGRGSELLHPPPLKLSIEGATGLTAKYLGTMKTSLFAAIWMRTYRRRDPQYLSSSPFSL